MATPVETLLPSDFLPYPAPHPIHKTRLDFSQLHDDDHDSYAILLTNVLSPFECNTLIAASNASCNGIWDRARINTGNGTEASYAEVRNCGRIMWDSQELADKIWERIKEHLPEIEEVKAWPEVTGWGPFKRGEVWKMARVN